MPKLVQTHYENLLAGMFTAHLTDAVAENQGDGATSRYGVGVMIRMDEIREALMSEDAKNERLKRDREHTESGGIQRADL